MDQTHIPQGANSLLAHIDTEICGEIARLGRHPFILVRQYSPPRFLVCDTQNDIEKFVDLLSRIPDLATNTLLYGIMRTLQMQADEAADLLSAWVERSEADFAERVYLGVPDGLACPAYYGYPVFERMPIREQGKAEERLMLLLRIFEAYECSDGNNAMRLALMQSLARALSRGLSVRGRGEEALRIVDRALAHLPQSVHLRAVKNGWNAKVRRATDVAEGETEPQEQEFFNFAVKHFDAAYYLRSYKDGSTDALDPLEHWLNTGFRDGRQISKSVDFRYGKIARRSSGRNWKHYRWRGENVAVRLVKPIPPEVMAQILNQARHDPAILVEDLNTVANLGDRESVGRLDVGALQRAVPRGAEFLVIVPNLSTSGDAFAIDLVTALTDAKCGSTQIIVTDQESSDRCDHLAIPKPFRDVKALWWQDFWTNDPGVAKLAQLVRVLNPRAMIVANSRVGHEMVAQFGRPLSASAKIFCTYTDTAESRELAVRLPRLTLPFATALTDDSILAARLNEQYGDLLGHGVVVLPRHTTAAFRDAVGTLFGSI